MAKKNFIDEQSLQAATQLEDDWVPVGGTLVGAEYSGGVINGKGYDQISYLLDYDKGDETQLDLKVQFSQHQDFKDSNGDDEAYERIVTDTSTAGVSTVLENVFKRTASLKFELPVSLRGWYVRMLAKRTGGTDQDAGTLKARYRLDNIDRN